MPSTAALGARAEIGIWQFRRRPASPRSRPRALEQACATAPSEDEIQAPHGSLPRCANNYLAAKMAEAMANGGEAPPSNEDGQAAAGGPNLGGQDFEDMLQALQGPDRNRCQRPGPPAAPDIY